ncbi:MAG TPA: hypothetical protein VLA93_18400, partial [Pyrinomonadaceae bacterium]|nr:hypothetical protein [Pyrinomonadaceae bacterium]
MNRIHTMAFRVVIASLALCSYFALTAFAQTPSPSPTQEAAKSQETKPAPQAPTDPFAPEPPGPLPAGMVGSDANDPRAKLAPGVYDAAEAAVGIKHLQLVKKPDAFQLGSNDPDNPKVQTTLGQLGMGDTSKIPKPAQLVLAQLAFANSDLAFQGNHLFLGNFYGVSIYDISDPAKAALLTSMVCPGGQGDVSVYKNLMFMSVEMPNGRIDCGASGFPPAAPSTAGQPMMGLPPAQKDRFRGVRVFDISDITKPKQVAAVQTCRGSHTHTLVVDPNDKNNVYIYVSGTSFVRQKEELEGCSGEAPAKDPNTALFRIEVIKVPLAAPQDAKIVSSPRLFMDPRTGVLNALSSGGSHGPQGTLTKPTDSDQCHDITVYSALGLAAGACSGNGILLDIKDPANPKRIDAVNDPNYAYWHSASFSNDGKKVVFTDEWGGGLGARCRATDPNKWGADAIFHLQDNKLKFASYYKLPAAQGDSENCVAHNGSLIPIPGRDVAVQGWYQGGISVMDFTDADHPVEIAYFDRGPIDPKMLILAGDWSAYWYNGHIYASEIARGLDIFELTPTKFLTQNEIDAAKTIRLA